MKSRYKGVFFDLDGTILDTVGQLAHSLNEARKAAGLEPQEKDLIRSKVGNGVRRLVEWSIEDDDADIEEIMTNYRSYYNAHCCDNTYPYDGIGELLKTLKDSGVKLFVVTNKSDGPAVRICEHFYPGLFDKVKGHRDLCPHKPDPMLVNEILDEFEMKPSECCLVGDSDVDIMTAGNAGLRAVSVTWGYKSEGFLVQNGAINIVKDADELLKILTEDG